MARPIARSRGSPPSCWPRPTVQVSKPAPAPAAWRVVKAEMSQQSPLWASVQGTQQRPSARVLSAGLFSDRVSNVAEGSKSYVESKGAKGQFFGLVLAGINKQALCLLNLPLGSVGVDVFWPFQVPFGPGWGAQNAFYNVVCDQSGADTPFISTWVCSTFAALRNRAHFTNMDVGLRGSLCKGLQCPLRTGGWAARCLSRCCIPIPFPSHAAGCGLCWGISPAPQTRRGLGPVAQHLRSPKDRQHQPCCLHPSGEGMGELFGRGAGIVLPCFDRGR